jgi:exodeoxyribonuclease V gamma subunit
VLGKPVVDRVVPVVEEIVRHVEPGETGSVDVKVELGDRALRGTVAGVCGDELRTITYSRVSARHRLAAWVRLLALTASADRPYRAVTIGRGTEGRVAVARIPPVGADVARRELAALLDVYDRGMREPLPLYCFTSAAFAQGGEAAARAAWESTWNQPKEDAEPEHVLVHGRVLPFEELDPRFARYAQAVWRGLLAHERVTDR